MSKTRATLQQVADRAQVSMSTASLVLSGKGVTRRIAEGTRTRILEAAEELNYTPNLLVRSLQRGRTNVIGSYNAYRSRTANDLYQDKLAAAIEHGGSTYGYNVLVFCDFSRSLEETYESLNGGLLDGVLLFAPPPDDPLLPLLRRGRLPVALLAARDLLGQFSSVVSDDEAGMRHVAEALARHGHRRVAILSFDVPAASNRTNLLRSLLLERGIEIPDRRIIDIAGPWWPTLLDQLGEKDPPTAVFCWHDRTAYVLLECCQEHGIEVPGQISVIGYDGIRWPSSTPHEAASVEVDLQALGDRGIRILDQYIKGYAGPPIEETLPVSFREGTTLGPAGH